MPDNSETVENPQEFIPQNEWMIKPCEFYSEEYSDCTSIKARFNQHFIYGKLLDCSQWKHDFNSCVKWHNSNDSKAAAEVIKSETSRRMERLRGHYGNDVWQKRSSPPEDWCKPLPEYLQKQYEATYLNLKAKELKGEILMEQPNNSSNSFCNLM